MTKELKLVECTFCEWNGAEDKLVKRFDEVEMTTLERCPKCDNAWGLVETGFTVKKSL